MAKPPALNTYMDLLFFEKLEHAVTLYDARITLHTLMLFYSSAKWFPDHLQYGIRLNNGYSKG